MSARHHRNAGLRKICRCGRRKWVKCDHPWHFNFRGHRFSLDQELAPRRLRSKTEAEAEADRLRAAIRDGTFRRAAPAPKSNLDLVPLEQMTLSQLLALYERRYLVPKAETLHQQRCACTRTDWQTCPQAQALRNERSQIKTINGTPLVRHDGITLAFGDWPVNDITTDTIDLFQETRRVVTTVPGAKPAHKPRRVGGKVGTNRNLTFLRAAYNWCVRKGVVERTPFKRGTESVVQFDKELARERRLEGDEAERLLKACQVQTHQKHLYALVTAAIETGARKGELLSLQVSQLRWGTRPEIVFRGAKTKTSKPRTVPMSSDLRKVLEMRLHDPDGEPLPPTAYVFGNELGQRIRTIKTAWQTACRRAGIVDLHFHDLRREAGSRWLEGGVPLHTVRDWLGHTDIAQTSTYLATTFRTQHDAMAAYERRRLQMIANEVGTSGQTGVPSTTTPDQNPNDSTSGPDPTTVN